MIFLLNVERVLIEVVELARLKIADTLGVDPAAVTVTFQREDNRLVPNFNVQTKVHTSFEEKLIAGVISETWLATVKPECELRLEGLFKVPLWLQRKK